MRPRPRSTRAPSPRWSAVKAAATTAGIVVALLRLVTGHSLEKALTEYYSFAAPSPYADNVLFIARASIASLFEVAGRVSLFVEVRVRRLNERLQALQVLFEIGALQDHFLSDLRPRTGSPARRTRRRRFGTCARRRGQQGGTPAANCCWAVMNSSILPGLTAMRLMMVTGSMG